MKLKNLLLSLFVLALCGVGAAILNHTASGPSESIYIPRSELNNPGSINGAMEYYKMIRANIYTGEVEMDDVLRVQKNMKKYRETSKDLGMEWEQMGPDNIGGRTRAIYPFNDNPNKFLMGGVSGGLFVSNNGGQLWERVPSFDQNLCVSKIARLGNGALYVATGNSRESPNASGSSGFLGGGLFKSEDEGETWELVSDFAPQPFNTNSNWAVIDAIKADPINPDKLWIGSTFGVRAYIHNTADLEPAPTGLPVAPAPTLCNDLEISSDGQTIVAAVGNRGYLSTDGGNSFSQLTNADGFVGAGAGSMEFAISPDDSDYMYCAVPTAGQGGALLGVFASVNGGEQWHMIAPASQNSQGQLQPFHPYWNGNNFQGNYDNALTVVPGHPGKIILGGIQMHRWELIGSTPTISNFETLNINFYAGNAPFPYYVHSDIHTFEWDANGNLYVGCDGGFYKSPNASANQGEPLSFIELNRDFITTQFYGIGISPEGRVVGGTQDNGSLYLNFQGNTPREAVAVSGGDGFAAEISQMDPDFLFTTLYYGTIFRSTDDGLNANVMSNLNAVSGGTSTDFYTDIRLYENANDRNSMKFINFIANPTFSAFVEYETPEITEEGDTIIGYIPAGTDITAESVDHGFDIFDEIEEDLFVYLDGESISGFKGDTAFVQDYVQAMMATALTQGVFVTREPLKTSASPEWYRIDTGEPGTQPGSLEFSPDGDHLYVGYQNGKVKRYSGFNSAYTENELSQNSSDFIITETVVRQNPGPVLDIEVDYSEGMGGPGNEPASEKVILAIGGYGGGSQKLLMSENAATTTATSSFLGIWNTPSSISGSPVYSVVMDRDNPDIIIAGTEYGIWGTDDNGATWSEENGGDMSRVPIFDLRQQKAPAWKVPTSGMIYVGSHGRGIFKSDNLFSPPTAINDRDQEKDLVGDLLIYPNPLSNEGKIQFDLSRDASVELMIFSMDGKLVHTVPARSFQAGPKQNIRFNADNFETGTYIVNLRVGNTMKYGKFVKSN